MLKTIYTSALLSFIFIANAQQKVSVAFYNQENLFDTINDPNKNDEEFLPEGKYKWNTEKYSNKLNHMAQVIASMNEDKGVDFIGMCEVESIDALVDLSKNSQLKEFSYQPVFFEGADERGIDNAFLYKSSLVKNASGKTFEINPEGLGGDHTRNILLAEITLLNNEKIYFIVNHWPSRREGENESEFKRKFVASEVRKICDGIYKTNPKANIIVMGDLNDEPTNLSVIATLGATGAITRTKDNLLFNTMYALAMDGQGSHKYQGKWGMLDQIIISANLLNEKSKVQYLKESAQVYKQNFMLETAEKYRGNPFRTFVGNKYLNGYSDHLPVMIYLNIGK
jgi:endonuclease/exonuclease/phosphatase family metal-dependent hydrolase